MMRIQRTDGDFPHVRKPGVRLACACSTCCCLVIVGAGLGLVSGGVAGILTGVGATVRLAGSPRGRWFGVTCGVGLLLVLTVVYAVTGLLIGAGLGFAADTLFGTFK